MHGVSGAPAETILDHPIVSRVAGDQHAGFYRPRPGTGPPGGCLPGVTVEAYRWGALTAGAAARTGAMLLLLPFMLGNVAIWLRPPGPDRAGVLGILCRLLAGTLTVAFMLSMIGVTMNLVGWQCVPYVECRAGRPWLSWLAPLPVGPRLMLLSLLPLLALRLFWEIGARSSRALEGFTATAPTPAPPPQGTGLASPGFWDDERIAYWLRQVHVGLGASTLDAGLLNGLSAGHRGVVGVILLYAAGALVLFCTLLLCLPVPTGRTQSRTLLRVLWVAIVAVTGLTLSYAGLSGNTRIVVGQLPGFEGSAGGLVTVQGVLLMIIALVTVLRRRPELSGARPFLRGLGTPLVGALSVITGTAFSATLDFRVADLLDRGDIPDPVRPNPPTFGPLEPPVAYWWAALAGLLALVVVVTAAAATLLGSRRRRRALADRVVKRDYPDAPPEAAPRLEVVRRTIAKSQVTDRFGPVLAAFFVVSALGLATMGFDLLGIGPTQLVARVSVHGRMTAVTTAYATDAGIWVLSLLVLSLVIVGFRARRSTGVRRLVAIVWDLGTFWPRTVHPFAPPCYVARAVPELTKRVTALAGQGPVVISGHSQGSVLAVATILQLPTTALPRVALMTNGSPLSRIYARLYPAYLGQPALCDLGERLDWRWRNLWRDTDPIGGAIFDHHRGGQLPCPDPAADQVDIRLRDPSGVTVDPADTVPPPLERHFPYYTNPAYQKAIQDLIGMVK